MKKSLPLFLASAVAAPALIACVPYEQPSYIFDDAPYSIRLNKDAALKRFLIIVKDQLPSDCKFNEGTSTLEAEIIDFTNAVNRYFPQKSEKERKQLIDNFTQFITSYRGDDETCAEISDYPEMPGELEEFYLFLAGRDILMREAPDTIPFPWEKLLSLPPEKRHYRTVWVHFMLGNHFKDDLHKHYDNCREAAKKGFADTAGLALRSYILEERYGQNIARVIRRAAEAEANNNFNLTLLNNIGRQRIDQLDDGQYFALINDPVCREFLALTDTTPRFRRMVRNTKFRSADICAYYACEEGDFAEAKEFIAMLEKPTLLSTYIEATIARYNGNIPLAVKKLRQFLALAAQINPADTPELLKKMDCESGVYEGEDIRQDVYGILGLTMVMRRDFMEAAKFFYDAGQLSDLEHVTEKFMTLDELVKFIDSIETDAYAEIPERDGVPDFYSKPAIARKLRYLAARRAFREGKYDLADKYMPKEFQKLIWDYQNFIKTGNNTALSGDERALALYNAAKILRHKGMELSGTAGKPDNFPGNFGHRMTECQDCTYNTMLGTWTLCQTHRLINNTVPGFNAIKDHNTVPAHQRFHYRYLAADLALRAGTLAENEELRALINLFGGECLKMRSPQEADIFYKRLVLDSRSTLLGKLADKQRWFPVIEVLQKEIQSVTPVNSLDDVKKLMQQAFPAWNQ